jgi:glucuronate isomerase
MANFIHDDFLLQNQIARRLYHEVAETLPIIDYHCHTSPKEVAENRKFANLFEIWLEGDHYKWRGMRSNGVAEKYCTGDASPYEKFLAYAETVPHTLRNPLYHWSHLELKRYFGIDELLSPATAEKIWHTANEQLKEPRLSAHGILDEFQVQVVCTTDDPADSLEWHTQHAKSGHGTKLLPAFRPDALLKVDQAEFFRSYLTKLGKAADVEISDWSQLQKALEKRHQFFHDHGCRLSDHGLENAHSTFGSAAQTSAIFDKALTGAPLTAEEVAIFRTSIMVFSGQLDAQKGWTKQLHLGAMRNNNTRKFHSIGADTGFDSIGDYPQAVALSRYLDRLDADNLLPKTIVYNLNPADNYVMGTMLGNFQDGSMAGKVQMGSGWWFLDQKEAMEWQLNTLSNLGLLSRFVGMLTDSRSFMSYPRHEYFRRTFCNLIGQDVEFGVIPNDFSMAAELVRKVCYENAREYFGFFA